MITDWINVSRITISGAEHLYPRGIDWAISPGVNAVIGGTSLGKTTLVYTLQFAIFGKMVVASDERIEREFFADRLTRHRGKFLKENPPLISVEFRIGGSTFVVKRNPLSGSLVSAACDGQDLKPADYETSLTKKAGLDGDFEGLIRLQEHLFFFGESRYLLAWENKIQHELINLMMSDHAIYRRLDHLWTQAESADSEARNISTQACTSRTRT